MPARGDTQSRGNAVPGTLNYVEGQVSLDSQPLNSKSIGEAIWEPGQSITTENGKAEVLLTPGVFLGVGSNSAVKMISPSLTNTEIGVEEGEASVECAEIHKQNDIRIDADGVTTELLKNGYYDFDAAHNQVRVLDGEAIVDDSGRQVKVKGGHELTLNQENTKPQGFDKKLYESSDLYNWSSLRSAYLAEANVDLGPSYIAGGGYGLGWYGAGWYWDPWFSAYTFIPGDGIFYSPFGWGFYSPFYAFYAFDAPISLAMDASIITSIMTIGGGVLAHITRREFAAAGFILVMDMQRRRADMLAMVSAAAVVEQFAAADSRVAEVASMAVVDLEVEDTGGKEERLGLRAALSGGQAGRGGVPLLRRLIASLFKNKSAPRARKRSSQTSGSSVRELAESG